MSAELTAYEKTQVLFYLGYSIFEDDGPAIRAINGLGAKPLAGDFIRPLIQKLVDIDKDIHAVRPLTKAITDGSIELRAAYTLKVLQKLGRDQVGRLATITKISVFSDVFSPGMGTKPDQFYSGDPSEHRIDPSTGVPRLGT